jgi:hypothetical protein
MYQMMQRLIIVLRCPTAIITFEMHFIFLNPRTIKFQAIVTEGALAWLYV